MIGFFALMAVLLVASAVGLVREALLDRPAEIPRSRSVDPDFLPPTARRPMV